MDLLEGRHERTEIRSKADARRHIGWKSSTCFLAARTDDSDASVFRREGFDWWNLDHLPPFGNALIFLSGKMKTAGRAGDWPMLFDVIRLRISCACFSCVSRLSPWLLSTLPSLGLILLGSAIRRGRIGTVGAVFLGHAKFALQFFDACCILLALFCQFQHQINELIFGEEFVQGVPRHGW